MENKVSKEYVAELLKQLQELKRKKAYKERKLQKLKGCSIKEPKKQQTSSVKSPDQNIANVAAVTENCANKALLVKTTSRNHVAFEKDTFSTFTDSKCIKHDTNQMQIDEDEYACKKGNSLHLLNKMDKNVESYFEKGIQNPNEENIKSSILAQNETNEAKKCKCSNAFESCTSQTCFRANIKTDVDFTVNCLEQISNPDVEMLKTSKNVVHNGETINTVYDNKEKLEVLSTGLKSVLAPVIDNDFDMCTFQDIQNSPSNSKKSSLSDKNKSSDILDDSLNEKIISLSSDLFDNNFIDKEGTVDNCNATSTCVTSAVCSNLNVKISDHNAKSPISSNSLSTCEQNNPVFNFPKFSTPTDVYQPISSQIYQSGKVETPNSIDTSCSTKNIRALNERFEDNTYSQNKFDSSHINHIIGKSVSSVLDAHYESPKKITLENDFLSNLTTNKKGYFQDVTGEAVFKKRKLSVNNGPFFQQKSKVKGNTMIKSSQEMDAKPNDILCDSFQNIAETDEKSNDHFDFNKTDEFDSISLNDNQCVTFVHNSCNDVSFQVVKAVDGIITKVCTDSSLVKNSADQQELSNCIENNILGEDMKLDGEIQIIPETEGLELYFSKDTEDFLETSALSQNRNNFHTKEENLLNVSSQSKLESSVINNIVDVKSSKTLCNSNPENDDRFQRDRENCNNEILNRSSEKLKVNEKESNDAVSAFENTLGLDMSFLEDDTQELGHFKQVPYMNETNIKEVFASEEIKTETESNLNFTCCLNGTANEPVIDTEVILFGGVKYAVIQHTTDIHIWIQEKNKGWIKIFSHHIEDMLSLIKISTTMDDDNLVIVMLLSDDEKYCLQFLLFEKDDRVIKLMENTHWLEERCFENHILLCGLNGLMFATSQNKENPEVSLHALISLKESPRLMTAVLGSTDTRLCSLCKIDKLPNALLGISNSMIYVWHILEARLVTAVHLHPQGYLPIKECFWATVENGLIFFLTTCESKENNQACQLLAANLATGFCQSAMTYSTQPSNNKIENIIKASYLEPFLVVAHSNGAFIWTVMEEFCCAALSSKPGVTTVSISRDFKNWGILALGSKFGYIDCYSIN